MIDETVTVSQQVQQDLAAAEAANEQIDVVAEKEKMLQSIPRDPADQAKLLAEVEESYYQVGNIYNFQLDERENAINAFETLIVRFDTSAYKPEVLYQLYLLYKDRNTSAAQEKATHLQKNSLSQSTPSSYPIHDIGRRILLRIRKYRKSILRPMGSLRMEITREASP